MFLKQQTLAGDRTKDTKITLTPIDFKTTLEPKTPFAVDREPISARKSDVHFSPNLTKRKSRL